MQSVTANRAQPTNAHDTPSPQTAKKRYCLGLVSDIVKEEDNERYLKQN